MRGKILLLTMMALLAIAISLHAASNTTAPLNSTAPPPTPTNSTSTNSTISNSTQAQNSTCVAALVHVTLSQLFYERVYPLANSTHNNESLMLLSEAKNLTTTAEKLINESQCFTALKDAIEAIHLEQKAFVLTIHSRHINGEIAGLLAQANQEKREAAVLLREATAFNATGIMGNLTQILGELNNITSYLKTGNLSSTNLTGIKAELRAIRAELNFIRRDIVKEKVLEAAANRVMLRASLYINSTSAFYNNTGNSFAAYKRLEHLYNDVYRAYNLLLMHGLNDTQIYQVLQQLQSALANGPQGIGNSLGHLRHAVHVHGSHGGSGHGKHGHP
ncbi:MAG: hypothetical protein RXR16_01585 [Thermocladium sp.]